MYTPKVILGGTFDPPHVGHLRYAQAAARALETTVHLMPAADPVHRATPGAGAGHRWAMVEALAAQHPELTASAIEIDLGPPTFSARTLRAIRTREPACAPVLLLGSDAFGGLPSWREYPRVLELGHFVYVERPDQATVLSEELAIQWDRRRIADGQGLRQSRGGRMLRLVLDLVPMSATRVRAAIATGASIAAMVPPVVAAYIEENQLYRASDGNNGLQ